MKLLKDDTGNCYAACISSLTGIPFKDLRATGQEIAEFGSSALYARMLTLLTERGWQRQRQKGEAPQGFAVAVGRSPRGPWNHAVIVCDGEFYHDPHPSNLFLPSVESYHVFLPISRP